MTVLFGRLTAIKGQLQVMKDTLKPEEIIYSKIERLGRTASGYGDSYEAMTNTLAFTEQDEDLKAADDRAKLEFQDQADDVQGLTRLLASVQECSMLLAHLRKTITTVKAMHAKDPLMSSTNHLRSIKESQDRLERRLEKAALPAEHPLAIDADGVIEEAHAMQASLSKSSAAMAAADDKKAAELDSLGNMKMVHTTPPTFSGDQADWMLFWSDFQAINDTRRFTPQDKLRYLKQAMLDPGLKTYIINLMDRGATYEEVVDALKKRFDRPRVLHKIYVEQLMKMTPFGPYRTAISDAMDKVSGIYSGLIKLGQCDAESIFTTVMEALLPTELATKWADVTIDQKKVPPIQELLDFLNERMLQSQFNKPEPIRHSATPKRPVRQGSVHVTSSEPAQQPEDQPEDQPEPSTPYQRQKSPNRWKPKFVPTPCRYQCPLCSDTHYAYNCDIFKSKSVDQRQRHVTAHSLCVKCFKEGHKADTCRSRHNCHVCQGDHNTLVHGASQGSANPSAVPATTNMITSSQAVNGLRRNKLMMTCMAKVTGPTGRSQKVRCLLDSASDVCSITTRVANQLQVNYVDETVALTMFSKKDSSQFRAATFNISSFLDPEWSIEIVAAVTDHISEPHPRTSAAEIKEKLVAHGDPLADPTFDTPGKIDVLLGSDVMPYVLSSAEHPSSLIALSTVFGKAIMGTWKEGEDNATDNLVNAAVNTVTTAPVPQEIAARDEMFNSTMIKFWETEQPPKEAPAFTPEELRVQEEYNVTHAFIPSSGRYQVTLPRKQNKLKLGDSRAAAHRRYICNERALMKKGHLEAFQKEVQSYFDLNHARPLTSEELHMPSSETFYLPMHGVHKSTSTTTKLRVVFDASCKSSTGVSLNDTLCVGPMLHPSLEQILLKFRTYRVALNGDISKMYREILLAPADQQFHRFLWRAHPDQEIRDHCMLRVTFGVASSPYVAVRTLQQACTDFGEGYPLAQYHIYHSFYVDDLLGGANSEQEALEVYNQVHHVLSKGGFTLRKIRSSSPWVLSQISPSLVEPVPSKELVDCHSAAYPKALGLAWGSHQDQMATDVNKPYTYVPTKRGILSDISKTFDVMGWITPVILPMKLMMRELWKSRKDWDEAIDIEQAAKHETWREELSQLEDVALQRCYFTAEPSQFVQIHAFCDASESAFGAVVYVRSVYEHGPPTCRLAFAKSRVAPVATRTLPQLELCGAVLLTQIVQPVCKALDIPLSEVMAWGDSTVVLCWLQRYPSNYETFVANRITSVTSCIASEQWHHVPSTENPADCASRGISAADLHEHQLWWSGPSWLSQEPFDMPRQPLEEELRVQESKHLKKKIIEASCSLVSTAPSEWLVRTTMSWRTLTHVAAWLRRACYNFAAPLRHQPLNRDASLTVEEVKGATIVLLKRAQLRSYQAEVKGLTATPPQPISKGNGLLPLSPFLDSSGLIRIGGRLKNSELPYNQKYPILLSRTDPLTRVIFLSTHLSMSHCGPTLLLSSVGTEYYVSGAKRIAQSVCQSCVTCIKASAQVQHQLMGDLPADRVSENPGFHTVGIDYAGPYLLKTSCLRTSPKVKGYLAIFVCFATKGVHIEVVTTQNTPAFLAAMKRFVGRRGLPKHVYSDNGGCFKSAKRQLNEFYKWMENSETTQQVKAFFLDQQTTWHHIPERAPHFGGLWESAVKSAKHHLKRVIGEQSLTYEEMATVIIQIEACLNSRPLWEQNCHSIDGIQPLTPAHLLIGKALKAYPEAELDPRTTCRGRWIMCQTIIQSFWKRWSNEYLTSLQRKNKWTLPQPNLCVGDVVLMRDASKFVTHWGLARVVKVYPGDDGLVRAVDIITCKVILPETGKRLPISQRKMKTTTLRRPVAKLALLIRNERVLPLRGGCYDEDLSPQADLQPS